MESERQSRRLELLAKANERSELADEYFAKEEESAKRAQPEIETLEGQVQRILAETEEKRNLSNALSHEFRRLYEESHEAYANDDPGQARRLSQEAHKIKNKCETLNEEIGSLYDKIKRLHNRKAELISEAKSWHDRAITEIEKAKELRNQANRV